MTAKPEQENWDDLISRVYDVALDPARYEELLDSWEDSVWVRRSPHFAAKDVVSDPGVHEHFLRAERVMERLNDAQPVAATGSVLAELDDVAAIAFDAGLRIAEVNPLGQNLLAVNKGDGLNRLPVKNEDIDVLQKQIEAMLPDRDAPHAIFRVRSPTDGGFLVLHLRRTNGPDRGPLVVAVCSAINWPDGFAAVLREAFNLTSAEVEVVRLLLNCQSTSEIAAARGRSLGTIRFQIKTILAKTQTHGQVELVRLILSMMDITKLTTDHLAPPTTIGGSGALKALQIHTIYDADDRRLDYLIIGDPNGRPILYMPTEFAYLRWPASAEAAAVRRGIKAIAPIRGGYGLSDPPPMDVVYHEQVARDLIAVLDAEGATRVPVLSISDDFWLTIEVENMRPGTLSAIIATAGGLPYLNRAQVERMHRWHRFVQAAARYSPKLLPHLIKMGMNLIRRSGKQSFIELTYASSAADADTLKDPEVMEALLVGTELSMTDNFKSHEIFSRHTIFEQEPWLIDAVHSLKGRVPVHFLSGLQDPAMPEETLKEHFVEFDWIDFRTYPDAGQLLFFKHWRDALDAIQKYI